MIEELKKELDNLVKGLEEKLNNIRGYRFALHWLENIEIDTYNKKFPLKSLGSISQLEINRYKVEPWDINTLKDIEQGIKKTNFGGSVIREKNYLIVTFPAITEETKKNLLKTLNELKEEYRIKGRKGRDEFLKKIKEKKERKEISEDLFYKTKEKADKEIEDYNKKLDELFIKKEREVLG
ncbi:MAG: ribosome-recycling factor [Minisyncoccia bacterium]